MKGVEVSINLKNIHFISLLVILAFILIVELQVTFSTPINFGDEGYHTTIIQWLADKKEFPTWVPRISNEVIKPGYTSGVLYHLVVAGLMMFGFQEALLRFFVPFVAVFCGFTIFVLVKKIYNENIGWFSSILLVTFPSFVTYSVLFYRDSLFSFFLSLFFLVFILSVKENSKKYFFLSAIFAALSILLKVAGFVIYFFVAFVFLYELLKEKKFSSLFTKYFIWLAIVSAILLPFYLRNIYYYKGLCYLPYAPSFFEKMPILSSKGCSVDKYQDKYEFQGRVEQVGTEANVFSLGLTSYLNFAYGNLLITVFSFFSGLFLLISEKRKTDVLLILALLSFVPIFIISAGRAEDTARYTLGAATGVALVCGIWFDKLSEFLNRCSRHLGVIIFIFVLLYCYLTFMNRVSVLANVKKFSPTFFEACDWVKKNLPEDARLMTIWAYRAIYNCQRDCLGNQPDIALSKDLNLTLEAAKVNGITHLFIQKFSVDAENKHFLENYDLEFIEFLESHPEHFVKVYENGVPLEECKRYWRLGYPCDGNIIYEIRW